jgi:hypothetical protein
MSDNATKGDKSSWVPAIIAVMVLLLMAGFIACGFATWMLFNKRAEFAAKTLRDGLVPDLQQTQLSASEKDAITRQLTDVVQRLEQGILDNRQATGIMQRLVSLPLLAWGDLDGLQALIAERGWSESDVQAADRALSRAKRAVELGRAQASDIETILDPVTVAASGRLRRKLNLQPTDQQIRECLSRATQLADQEQVPDQSFQVKLSTLVQRAIEDGEIRGPN